MAGCSAWNALSTSATRLMHRVGVAPSRTRPRSRPGEFGEFAPHRFGVGEHAARERQQRLARDRQRAAAAGAVEELGAEILLERGDLAAQRGLRQVQLLGGPGEVAEPSHLDEAAQLLEVHIHSLRASSLRYICIGVIG